jgi:hypothetical protein
MSSIFRISSSEYLIIQWPRQMCFHHATSALTIQCYIKSPLHSTKRIKSSLSTSWKDWNVISLPPVYRTCPLSYSLPQRLRNEKCALCTMDSPAGTGRQDYTAIAARPVSRLSFKSCTPQIQFTNVTVGVNINEPDYTHLHKQKIGKYNWLDN